MNHTIPTESQDSTVLCHLKKYGKITSIEAIRLYRITRLSGRIYNLIKSGHNITSETKHSSTNRRVHWAEYTLVK